MPPQTRRNKTVKASKENIGVLPAKSRVKNKVTKERKVLADKTNSASDENLSTELVKKVAGLTDKVEQVVVKEKPTLRSRRDRKLPNRYNENQHKKNEVNKNITNKTPIDLSPLKTPQKSADSSIIVNRPKRVCRLPSKFNDHSLSPHKFIPVGCHASTPIVQNKNIALSDEITPVKQTKRNNHIIPSKIKLSDKITSVKETKQKEINNKRSPLKKLLAKAVREPLFVKVSPVKETIQNKLCYNISPQKKNNKVTAAKLKSDANNNAGQRKLKLRKGDNKNEAPLSSEKVQLPREKSAGKNILQHSLSFRVLEDKQKPTKRGSSHLDVYEFTYDPNEEPPPKKKKQKKTVRKKPTKPKTVTFKNNYDQNVSKALAVLKNVVSKKTESQVKDQVESCNNQRLEQIVSTATKPVIPVVTVTSTDAVRPTGVIVPENSSQKPVNNMSTRVEDIEADFEPLMDHNDINYSPVPSPNHRKSPVRTDVPVQKHTSTHDPLNLQDNLSFFDDVPIASSSINTSVRRAHASPWRVQFEQLPIKWQVNTYIKPNMTPAVESSFINFNDSNKKKHVYTNLVSEANEELPEIVSNDRPNLKQTSIISFIREVVERSASKKKRAVSVTPTKANSVFDDISATSTNKNMCKTPNKTPNRLETNNCWTPNNIQSENVTSPLSEDKENLENSGKRKVTRQTGKSANKEKECTFFGFDESEDLENDSPVKIDNPRVRALRPRARDVLREINAQSGVTRATVPLAAKTNVLADAVNKVYEQMKSATDAPVFNDKNTNIDPEHQQAYLEDEDSQSIHLFEDIELVHHAKPSRKSYGKAKKVAFQTTEFDSDSQSLDAPLQKNNDSSEEDDLADLTFTLPNVAAKNAAKSKVTKKKKQQSKKEKAEMEAWAAQFNSMCEDVEEFPLVVE